MCGPHPGQSASTGCRVNDRRHSLQDPYRRGRAMPVGKQRASAATLANVNGGWRLRPKQRISNARKRHAR